MQAAYTLDNLVRDCASRPVRTRVGPVVENRLLSADTYRRTWHAMLARVARGVRGGDSVTIPMFGTVYLRTFNLGIKILQFDVADSFVSTYGLERPGPGAARAVAGPATKLTFAEVASDAGVDARTASSALTNLLEQLGEVASSNVRVAIDFAPLGVINCANRVIQIEFDQFVDAPSKVATSPRASDGRPIPGLPAASSSKDPVAARTAQLGYSAQAAAKQRASSPRAGLEMSGEFALPVVVPVDAGDDGGLDSTSGQRGRMERSWSLRSLGASSPRVAGSDKVVFPYIATQEQIDKEYASGGAGSGVIDSAAPAAASKTKVVLSEFDSGVAPESSTKLSPRSQGLVERQLGFKPGEGQDLLTSPRGRPRLAPPPLLDTYSRTRLTPFGDKIVERPLVDRLATLYSPAASKLTLNTRKRQLMWIGGRARAATDASSKGAEVIAAHQRIFSSGPHTATFEVGSGFGAHPVGAHPETGPATAPNGRVPAPPPRKPGVGAPPASRRAGGRSGLHLKTKLAEGKQPDAKPDVLTGLEEDGSEFIVSPRSPWRATYKHRMDFYAPTIDESAEASKEPDSGPTSLLSSGAPPAGFGPSAEVYGMSPRAAHEQQQLSRVASQKGGASSQSWRASAQRYLHYLLEGVQADELPVMKEDWIRAVMQLLPPPPPPGSAPYDVAELLSNQFDEVRRDYERAVRKSIVDYVLRSPAERTRLGITVLPPECMPLDWGWSAGVTIPRTPRDWKERFWDACDGLNSDLYVTSPAMQALNALWADFSHRRLVDVPTTERGALERVLADAQASHDLSAEGEPDSSRGPPSLGEFAEQQNSFCDAAVREFNTSWIDAAAAIVAEVLYPGHMSGAAVGPQGDGAGSAETAAMAATAAAVQAAAAALEGHLDEAGVSRGRPVASLPHFFACVATHVSKQLRSVVEGSLEDLCAFVERFASRKQRRALRRAVGRHRRAVHQAAVEQRAQEAAQNARSRVRKEQADRRQKEMEEAEARRARGRAKRKAAQQAKEQAELEALRKQPKRPAIPRSDLPPQLPTRVQRRTEERPSSASSEVAVGGVGGSSAQEAARREVEAAAQAAAEEVFAEADAEIDRSDAPPGLEGFDAFERSVLSIDATLDVVNDPTAADWDELTPFSGETTARLRPAITVQLRVQARASDHEDAPITFATEDTSAADATAITNDDGMELSDGITPVVEDEVYDGKGVDLEFSPSATDVENVFTALYDHIGGAFTKMQRIEMKLGLGSSTGEGSKRIPGVSLREDPVQKARERMVEIIRSNMSDASVFAEVYNPFIYILTERERLHILLDDKPTLRQCGLLIDRYRASVEGVKSSLADELPLDFILLDCRALKSLLIQTGEDLAQKVLDYVVMRFVSHNMWLTKQFREIHRRMAEPPADSEALVEAEAYTDRTRDVEIPALEKSLESARKMLAFLLERRHRVTVELLQPLLETVEWSRRMDKVMWDGEALVKRERERLEHQFQRARDAFQHELEDLAEQVDSFKVRGNIADLFANSEEVEAIQKQLVTAEETAQSMNAEERRLGWPVTTFSEVETIEDALEPFSELWNLAVRHHRANVEWTRKCVFKLDAEQVAKDAEDMHRSAFKLARNFQEEWPQPAAVADGIRRQVAEFRKHLPLLQVMCTEGMTDRHWREVSETVGFSVRPDNTTDLTKLVDIGMEEHIEKLEVIAEAARKEYSIQKALQKMRDEWAPLQLDLLHYKDSGTCIISGTCVDEIQELLDDHALKVQGLSSSSFAAPFMEGIREREKFVRLWEALLEVWVKVQATWLYLSPIFASEDINMQIPKFGKMFATVDTTWREIMRSAQADPSCTAVARIDDIVERLRASLEMLEEVQIGLNAYLERKRLYFARFFFLSNDELLEILAETKDPTRVQPHLKKCFDGIAQLEFTPSKEIVAMCSTEGENVPLTSVVDPSAAHGAVEVWLLQVEEAMRDTVQAVMEESLADYANSARIEWVQKWPGQTVLTVSQSYWTREVEDALNTRGTPGLVAYSKVLGAQLQDIVTLVRGELTKLQRKTLSALTVIDVHARDVVSDIASRGVSDIKDFEWTSQLRYYWVEHSMQVRMINSSLNYAYEYLGNSSRLVITPLTDRCYRTLIGAVYLQYGGAPEGPAGTGKTETVKDLAKALARQCVVFNCSDQLDYLAMAKFFKGLASSGAWACFDEFNRIQLEVLSVIAQQITTIQQAIAAKLVEFDFEGTHIKLKWTANVFITMNPGYAGRAELPDNLKVLFRSVAMMVPDYALIAEIILYSLGYLDARNLAGKIVATYKLCSEQLSRQSHYDYGMRAVIAVLNAAGSLKRRFPEQDESLLMLRAINDVNLAKFLAPDLPLFEGITSDLFPGVVLPEPDYEDFMTAVTQALSNRALQPVDYTINKIVQTYEMMLVRHGFMVVGDPLSGKTSALHVLADALTELAHRGKMPCNLNPEHELPTRVHTINPKSLGLGHLYGQFDEISHEWTNGVLALTYRKAAADTDEVRHWIVFDGPVDAIWIENMNTVLDDNKKLCLMSGEIIAMTERMSMIFEPMDLAVASPATVSRCGMVYFEPHKLGWQPFLKSWLASLPEVISSSDTKREFVSSMFSWLMPQALRFVQKSLVEFVPQGGNMVAEGLMGIMSSCLSELAEDGDQLSDGDVFAWIESAFLFALTWSVGGVVNASSRQKFDIWLRRAMNGDIEEVTPRKVLNPLPSSGTAYDFMLSAQPGTHKAKWVLFSHIIEEEYDIPKHTAFNSIIVPTVDTARYSLLLRMAAEAQRHILFVGPTGTGKTIYVKDELRRLNPSVYSVLLMGLSAQTTAGQVQDILETGLEKRKKYVRGPPLDKRMLVFVDDLNMPKVEEYGAQPPLELLRQGIGSGGWYETKDMHFMKVIETTFISAMGPPGGGRNPVSPRLLRLFQVVGTTALNDATMTRIFSTILKWHFQQGEYSSAVSSMVSQLVRGTCVVYNTAITKLLPTPAKLHYTFNLRDFARVVQGLMQLGPNEAGTNCDKIARLWIHEVLRCFFDRLSAREDRDWFIVYLRSQTHAIFGREFDELLSFLDTNGNGEIDAEEELRGLLFGGYMTQGRSVYDQIPFVTAPAQEAASTVTEEQRAELERARDGRLVRETIQGYLDDLNSISTKPMNLVIFMFVIEHVSRISRILGLPGGHALLVGVGGSGRKSLTRLAAHIVDADVFQVESGKGFGVSEWRDFLKGMLTRAGVEGRPSVFLLADTQVSDESFLEDVNNLLNTGEVPNLFAPDEKQTLLEKVRVAAKAARQRIEQPAELYEWFVSRVKTNLHITLAFSPIGDAFRERLRQFPSLVSCCSIDWFTEWPEDALRSVAESMLSDTELAESLRHSCASICIAMQEDMSKKVQEFAKQERRHVYVTPTSYLELIESFRKLLTEKRNEVLQARRRYTVGLDRLKDTEASVEVMQQQLENLKPTLAQNTKETEEMMGIVDRETKEVEKLRKVMAAEEDVANAKANDARLLKEECEHDLEAAMPVLNAAVAALKTLKKADVVEVKSMLKPPRTVVLVMEAVCHFMGVSPVKVRDPDNPQKSTFDFWQPAKQHLLSDVKFLQNLMDYDKDNIAPRVIKAVKKFLTDPAFEPERIRDASIAAYGLSQWVRAMVEYDRINKLVEPKRRRLAKSQGEFEVLMESLRKKQAQLKEVEDRLQALDDKLSECEQRKKALEDEAEQTTIKLERAEKLITGLGGEAARWREAADELSERLHNLNGDVLLSAGVVAYLGAFTPTYRSAMIDRWVSMTLRLGIPCSGEDFSMVSVLGDPVAIRDWNIAGLPTDSFSVENAIMVTNARRWPLMIDPQGQANKWVRKMEKGNKLNVVKLGDKDLMRRLEAAVTFGRPMLLENVGEELDAALEPILLKQIFQKGSVMSIALGENTVEYSEKFRLYITTKLPNPHYLPELSVKVTLLNFSITPVGLSDQLLGTVVKEERPDWEEEKNKLIVSGAENKRALKEIEDRILKLMSGSDDGSILEDSTAIDVLTDSKRVASDIAAKQLEAEKTEAAIDEARAKYEPVATLSSVLFFCIRDMGNIDPMYQYSIEWFFNLFVNSIHDADKSEDIGQRVDSIVKHFTLSLFRNICRSLFEAHKLLFAFLLTARILQQTQPEKLKPEEWRFLLTGGVAAGDPPPKPLSWIPDRAWTEMCRLSSLNSAVSHITGSLETDELSWRAWYDSHNPHETALPAPYDELPDFMRLCVLRCMRPDMVEQAVEDFVARSCGEEFLQFPPFDLAGAFSDSNNVTPLVFLLSPGSDPISGVMAQAEKLKIPFKSLSLGQGQGVLAQAMIEKGAADGDWVVLQNCHLYPSWMPELEHIVENLAPEVVSPDFRLWLTSYPSSDFPTSILQNGIKMTNEPPRGLRSNLIGSLTKDPLTDPDFFDGCSLNLEFKRLLFGLCFFHAVVQERRSFGPLGWNVPYEFTDSDLRISARQLFIFLDEAEEGDIPYKALRYLVGECNYGGRVTDDRDRRTLLALLDTYLTPAVHDPDYDFSPSGMYHVPTSVTELEDIVHSVTEMAPIAAPEVFGLHENATLTKDQNNAYSMFRALLSTQSQDSGAGKSGGDEKESKGAEDSVSDDDLAAFAEGVGVAESPRAATQAKGAPQTTEDLADSLCEDILGRLPENFDIEAAAEAYPQMYEESMNTVLVQELERYNKLLSTVRDSLANVRAAIRGEVVMSIKLEGVFNAVVNGLVPDLWKTVSYPSLKPLASYVADLLARLAYFATWVADGPPVAFWLPGIFFTQSFLTGALQNYARKHTLPIDSVDFDFDVVGVSTAGLARPADGVLIEGLFLEGARWDAETGQLGESLPRVLFSAAPVLHFLPKSIEDIEVRPHYACPLYKTSERRGVLLTTGHSTNFVMSVRLPTERQPVHWVKRGVAMLTQLDT